jgi:hypothetical protein
LGKPTPPRQAIQEPIFSVANADLKAVAMGVVAVITFFFAK